MVFSTEAGVFVDVHSGTCPCANASRPEINYESSDQPLRIKHWSHVLLYCNMLLSIPVVVPCCSLPGHLQYHDAAEINQINPSGQGSNERSDRGQADNLPKCLWAAPGRSVIGTKSDSGRYRIEVIDGPAGSQLMGTVE